MDRRNHKLTSLFFCAMLVTTSCNSEISSESQFASSIPRGEFLGYDIVNQKLAARLAADPKRFRLDSYLKDEFNYGVTSLSFLLGGYSVNGYQNGKPNAINSLLWQVAFRGLGDDISSMCQGKTPNFELATNFATLIAQACKHKSMTKNEFKLLWQRLTFYDVTESEFEPWHLLFQNSYWDSVKPKEVVSSMVFTALYQPELLLQR